MVGCSAAVAAMAGGRIGALAFDEDGVAAAGNDEIIVTVFLRGGCDALNLVAPVDDGVYATRRGSLAVPASAGLAIDPRNSSYGGMALHPATAPLLELYQAGKLAMVHACGLTDSTRSHFDAMDYMERGTPGIRTTSSGWLARHMSTAGAGSGLVPALAASSSPPKSLLNEPSAVALTNPGSFKPEIPYSYRTLKSDRNADPQYTPLMQSLNKMYAGNSAFQTVGRRTLQTIETLSSEELAYTPGPGITYPTNSFGNALKLLAQMIKLEVGLRIATVDYGGWDTHEGQGDGGNVNTYFGGLVGALARGLHAFYNDLPAYADRLTIVVMSEFGRRLGVNASYGTDHGHGGVMMVLGGKTNGGQMYGTWPGLQELDENQDLKITTDFRRVLSEVLVRRLDNPKLGMVFPGYKDYTPLGITGSAADDLPIDYSGSASDRSFIPLVAKPAK